MGYPEGPGAGEETYLQCSQQSDETFPSPCRPKKAGLGVAGPLASVWRWRLGSSGVLVGPGLE